MPWWQTDDLPLLKAMRAYSIFTSPGISELTKKASRGHVISWLVFHGQTCIHAAYRRCKYVMPRIHSDKTQSYSKCGDILVSLLEWILSDRMQRNVNITTTRFAELMANSNFELSIVLWVRPPSTWRQNIGLQIHLFYIFKICLI